jgi:hypothetical protein
MELETIRLYGWLYAHAEDPTRQIAADALREAFHGALPSPHVDSVSGVHGVRPKRSGWQVEVGQQGYGTYPTLAEAAQVRMEVHRDRS